LVALDAAPLDEGDRLTHALLRDRLEAEVELDACKLHEWAVDSGGGSLFGELSYLVELHTVKAPADAANVVARMGQGRALLDAAIENLERGLAGGRVASAEKVRRAIDQLDAE